jgi:hypothetical protein
MFTKLRIFWAIPLILFSWRLALAQFNPITLPLQNGAIDDVYLGLDDGSTPLFWTRTWDYGQGKIYAPNNVLSMGGPVPDSAMIAYLDTTDGRIPGHAYIASQMGVPFWKASTDSTYFTFPGETDTFGIASGANGFFRLHQSLMYIYGNPNFPSDHFRGINDTLQPRISRVRSQLNGSHVGSIGSIVDPFLQPASNRGQDFGDGNPLPATTLQGAELPSVRWTLFSMMFVQDQSTIPFHWPGMATGDYSNMGTDGPHFAFNVWQTKGKFSGTVPLSLKWRGQQLIMVIQDPAGNPILNPILLGPNAVSGFTDSLSNYANTWLDFLVRTKPGYVSRGDNPGVEIYFKPSDELTWHLLYDYEGDLLSEIESNALALQSQYGIPSRYLGLCNGGIYPSGRLSNNPLRNYWTPFRLANPERAFLKIRHSEYQFAQYAEGQEPSRSTIFDLANDAMPPLGSSVPGPMPVEYLSFEAALQGSRVALSWTTASEANNDYFLIQRSSDGATWTSLQQVQGAGTSQPPRAYQVIDPSPRPGENLYRLQQVDLDGSTSFSPIRQVQVNRAEMTPFKVYPNPLRSGEQLTLQVPASYERLPLQVSVLDTQGRQVFAQTIAPDALAPSPATLHLTPDLANGLYVIVLRQGAQRSVQKLWVY